MDDPLCSLYYLPSSTSKSTFIMHSFNFCCVTSRHGLDDGSRSQRHTSAAGKLSYRSLMAERMGMGIDKYKNYIDRRQRTTKMGQKTIEGGSMTLQNGCMIMVREPTTPGSSLMAMLRVQTTKEDEKRAEQRS